jgi:MFS family permease
MQEGEVDIPGAAAAAPAQLRRVDGRALVAVLLAASLATLDMAIANTALPTIAVDLRATPAASIWIINAYQLAVVATLLPFAALGDLLGPRRVYLALPFFFEQVLHRDPVQTGFLMSPWPIVVAAAAPIAGRLSDRHAPGMLGGIGLVILALGE